MRNGQGITFEAPYRRLTMTESGVFYIIFEIISVEGMIGGDTRMQHGGRTHSSASGRLDGDGGCTLAMVELVGGTGKCCWREQSMGSARGIGCGRGES
jgi:hypothetical protein